VFVVVAPVITLAGLAGRCRTRRVPAVEVPRARDRAQRADRDRRPPEDDTVCWCAMRHAYLAETQLARLIDDVGHETAAACWRSR
jgi:hypothetical protein